MYVATVMTMVNNEATPFSVITSDDVVLASGWTGDVEELRMLIHPSLRPDELVSRADLGEFTKAVVAYHEGDLTAIDAIPVQQRGGTFMTQAWQVLRGVPAGTTISYAEYAEQAGRPAAVRAAAGACARNTVALFVPCHRVVRSDGSLGGFRYGVDIKQWLLTHEQAAVSALSAPSQSL